MRREGKKKKKEKAIVKPQVTVEKEKEFDLCAFILPTPELRLLLCLIDLLAKEMVIHVPIFLQN